MVKYGPPSPKMNTLDIVSDWTYADISTETLQIIRFFLEDMVPIDTANIEPVDSACDICADDLTSHRAVRLPCNHMFGENCIKKWLSPFMAEIPPALDWGMPVGANTCPKCRREFFPLQTLSDMWPAIFTRIKLWDQAYASVGIALSETESRARDDICRYLRENYGRGHIESNPEFTNKSPYPMWAHQRLLMFSHELKLHNLTPLQKHLREGLEEIATHGFPGGSRWLRGNDGSVYLEVQDPVDRDSVIDGAIDEEVRVEQESEELTDDDTDDDDEDEVMKFFQSLFQ